MKFQLSAVAIASCAVGVALGYVSGSKQPSTENTQTVQSRVAMVPATKCDSAMLTAFADEVRNDVREELASFKASLPVTMSQANATESTNAKARPSVEQIQAQALSAERARATVDGAIARRQWTQADADALRDEIGTMSQEQRSAVLSRIAVAINQGQIIPETERVPF